MGGRNERRKETRGKTKLVLGRGKNRNVTKVERERKGLMEVEGGEKWEKKE